MKRRQVLKNQQNQSKITNSFKQVKNQTTSKELDKPKSKSEHNSFFDDFSQNGASKMTTPYRSLGRINTLLKQSAKRIEEGSTKISAIPIDEIRNMKFNKARTDDMGTPSSVFTACTRATSVWECSSTKNDRSTRKRDKKLTGQQDQRTDKLAGSKRQSQLKLDEMEMFTRMQVENPKLVKQLLKLTDKKTGSTLEFPLYQEANMKIFDKKTVIHDFDMSKLEVEYDYDTDSEQRTHSKEMLSFELCQAIDFFVKEEPLKLVGNLAYY